VRNSWLLEFNRVNGVFEHMMASKADDAQRVYAGARYVFLAEIECQQYDAYERAEDEPTFGRATVLMLQFYAALWVSVEGWRKCPLSDETVDELLTNAAFEENVQLLRRFRNGVYHYQPDLINERLLAFLHEGEHAVTWAFLLHDEFKTSRLGGCSSSRCQSGRSRQTRRRDSGHRWLAAE
jgi:hypothetical protein